MQVNASLTATLVTIRRSTAAFDNKRYSPSFTHLNVDASHTQELGEGLKIWDNVPCRIADGPLMSCEQFSFGGLDTLRGYLESEVLGDNGVGPNLELRNPDVGSMLRREREMRLRSGRERRASRPSMNGTPSA